MDTLTTGAAIVAIVKLAKRFIPSMHDEWTVLFAVALGAVAGFFGVQGLDITQGVTLALGAVGTVSVADRVGGH